MLSPVVVPDFKATMEFLAKIPFDFQKYVILYMPLTLLYTIYQTRQSILFALPFIYWCV